MSHLRSPIVAGVVCAATLGGGLIAELVSAADSRAPGQTLLERGPSTLAAPSGHASTPGYNALPGQYSAPLYYAPSVYNAPPAYAPQPTRSPYGFTAHPAAYPAGGYQPTYAQAAPYAYQPSGVQAVWPYVQSSDGQASVMLGRSELLGGPPLASPQVQVPGPSSVGPYGQMPMQPTPHPLVPMNQAPHSQLQPQAIPGYGTPGYTMPGYPGGSAACDAGASGDASMYYQPVVRNWFGRAGGLFMTRDHGDHYTFSYGTGNEAEQRTDVRDAAMNWGSGFDVRFGKYFNCQRNAIEAVYWAIYPVSQSTRTVSPDVLGQLNGILNWSSLDYGGATADIFVNVAPGGDGIHRLTRDYTFQNLELNLWRFCGSCGAGKCGCSKLRSNWLIGVRYFQFGENLLFAADANDWDLTYEDDEIFYNIDIENNLLGFQIGNEAQYCLCDRLTADLGIKLGIYANQIDHTSEIGGNLGVATINNGPFIGEEFYISSAKNDVAFLGELNLGLQYCFSPCWTGTIGYRALAVTGVAMPADQIYPDLRGINDVANIDSSRGLILHGGYTGLEYNW